ncbi:gas vesicle protein [Streptomyces sp. CB01881]|uniref:gas vesicle protein n=1 Tax=Streptomyces sp. CB01881 TaxID=2078691 RepID=UPI000CDC6B29|nr:gas vesicle protein [Streptomyces sp. CB01881]AUY47893.1 gas vesicle protein [Streptomyces sp. CB01881]TYC76367.1 gas vesicle protein [Streptomyces sp. CB01881]
MTDPIANRLGSLPSRSAPPYGQSSASLADILERVLDKGIVIAGDIQINLLDIELLTIKLRLLIASVDKAKEMGIDWWEHDPSLSSRAASGPSLEEENRFLREQIEENRRLREQVNALRADPAALSPAEEQTESRDRSTPVARPKRAAPRTRNTTRGEP